LLLPCGEIDREGHGCGYNLLLTLIVNHKEEKLLDIRDELPALLDGDEGNGSR
jgi:hypothetical protein